MPNILANLDPENLKVLTKIKGYSIVSNHILEDGKQIMFMYREEPLDEEDSGWRFLSGSEDQDYLDDPDNSSFIGINVMANLDESLLPCLRAKIGSEFERDEVTKEWNPLN